MVPDKKIFSVHFISTACSLFKLKGRKPFHNFQGFTEKNLDIPPDRHPRILLIIYLENVNSTKRLRLTVLNNQPIKNYCFNDQHLK